MTSVELDSWSRVQARAMLLGVLAVFAGLPFGVLPALAALTFGALLLLARGRYTPGGGFGAANAVSLGRLGIVLAWAALARDPPAELEAAAIALCFALDGLDGWLARKRGTSSAFGAHFDMEIDALMVLLCAVVLARSGRLGGFILVPGLLRYAYVLLLRPRDAPEAPPSRFGRYAFGVLVVALIASLWPVPRLHEGLAMAASALIVASFARSTLWSFMARRRSDPSEG